MDMDLDRSFSFKPPQNGMLAAETEGNVKIKNVPLKSGMLVFMNHPASITVYKYVSITVLSGSVSVFGYEVNPRNAPLKVFSSEKTGLIEVKTETYEPIWKKKEVFTDLGHRIFHFTSFSNSKELLKNFENSTVAIFVKRCVFPSNVQFLELYYPHVFEFSLYKKLQECYVPKSKGIPIHFGDDEESFSHAIDILIRSAKLYDKDAPRIVVCGPRNSGKTTLLRFLINKILSTHECAYYLDTDPGQTEFTPPGAVSLTHVTEPIIGPPFCHQKKPIKMMFTGSISPTFYEMYSKSVSKLAQLYDENYADEPLFVNTMGWMQDMGLQYLKNTITVVKPTVLIEIVTKKKTSMFDYRECLSPDSHYFQICYSHEERSPIPADEMRDLSLLSYLGKCQNAYFGPVPLNEVKPHCVPWDKIPVFVFPGGNLFPARMIEAINESIVALCTVPESVILESDVAEFPKTLEPDPDNECLGYGLVTAVDEKEHLLYVVSPLKTDEWKKVNAIIKGVVMVPEAVILKQDIYNQPLPYTDVRKTHPREDEEEEEMETSMLSLKYTSETDSPAANSDARASVENYRKKIPKRYQRAIF